MELILNRDKPQVLLIAEGTYPYIRGGVSTWIDDLIRGMEEIKFGVVFLGSRRADYEGIRYNLPENLVYLSAFYLFEEKEKPKPRYIEGDKEAFTIIEKLHKLLKDDKSEAIINLIDENFFTNEVKYEDFLYSKRAWEHIVNMYSKYGATEPFVDYFWNVRNLHTPLWVVAQIAKEVGDFDLVHSPSTGYAGFLSALLKRSRKKPFILTEHGIYTRERKIDLMNAPWLSDKKLLIYKGSVGLSAMKRVWTRFFIHLGKVAYAEADIIISLFNGAREIQISYGADPEKCIVIPNGVNVNKLLEAYKRRPPHIPKVVALIGRVVPIKDIKTFIKAMKLLVEKIPEAEGWVVGPTDEDPEYYAECLYLVKVLGLEEKVKFLGFQRVEDILPKVGLLTLTSISEGMPYTVLEGFAGGVPCVATDVGSCRQLIYGGLNEEDIKLGKAGEVVSVKDANGLAESYAKLLTDESLWKSCQKTALERVKRFYSREAFLENYRKLYSRFLSWQA